MLWLAMRIGMIGGVLTTSTFVMAQSWHLDHLDVQLDPVESRSGWRSHNTITLDTGDYKSGTASLKSVGSGKDRFRKTFATPLNVSNMRYLTFWYYVDDPKNWAAVIKDKSKSAARERTTRKNKTGACTSCIW